MNLQALLKPAIWLGGLYAVAHFSKNAQVKAACYGAMGVIAVKQIPGSEEVL